MNGKRAAEVSSGGRCIRSPSDADGANLGWDNRGLVRARFRGVRSTFASNVFILRYRALVGGILLHRHASQPPFAVICISLSTHMNSHVE